MKGKIQESTTSKKRDKRKFNASQTTDIETNFTNRDIIVTNMEEFVNKFPVSEREKIRQMLDSNELNYYCK